MDVIANVEAGAIIDEMVGVLPADTLQLLLFVNNVPFTCTIDITGLVECSAPGYARKSLTGSSWTGSILCAALGPIASYVYPDQTFTMTGPGAPAQTIYGHAFYSTLRGQLKWGQTWATPFLIPAGGGVVVVKPSLTLNYCTE